MTASQPKTPHTLVKAPDIQVPYMETFRQAVPRHPVVGMLHFDIENVRPFLCVWHEFSVTRRFAVVENLRGAAKNERWNIHFSRNDSYPPKLGQTPKLETGLERA